MLPHRIASNLLPPWIYLSFCQMIHNLRFCAIFVLLTALSVILPVAIVLAANPSWSVPDAQTALGNTTNEPT